MLCNAIKCKLTSYVSVLQRAGMLRWRPVGHQKTPFNVFHGLSAHSTAVMQRLDRKLGCRIAEQIINQRHAHSYTDGGRAWCHRTWSPRSPGKWSIKDQPSHRFCHQLVIRKGQRVWQILTWKEISLTHLKTLKMVKGINQIVSDKDHENKRI